MNDSLSSIAKNKVHVLVPAAGSGQRFGGPVPKQYMPLCGVPIIQRSLESLLAVTERVTLAVAEDDHCWQNLDIASNPGIQRVAGGHSRAESVQNALQAIDPAEAEDWVLIHDAVRPLIARSDIERLVEEISVSSAAGGLLGTPILATVKRASEDAEVIKTEDRKGLWVAQTPQIFRYGLLAKALEKAGASAEITDEASAMEAAGHSIKLVAGCRTNIKITRPQDLEFAELIMDCKLKQQAREQ